MNDRTRWPRRVYVGGGFAGLVLVGVAYALARGHATTFTHVLTGVSCLVICAWMAEGLSWHRRQQRAREKAQAEAARERAREEETRRALQETLAKRTVSYGGMTINLHKAHELQKRDEAVR